MCEISIRGMIRTSTSRAACRVTVSSCSTGSNASLLLGYRDLTINTDLASSTVLTPSRINARARVGLNVRALVSKPAQGQPIKRVMYNLPDTIDGHQVLLDCYLGGFGRTGSRCLRRSRLNTRSKRRSASSGGTRRTWCSKGSTTFTVANPMG